MDFNWGAGRIGIGVEKDVLVEVSGFQEFQGVSESFKLIMGLGFPPAKAGANASPLDSTHYPTSLSHHILPPHSLHSPSPTKPCNTLFTSSSFSSSRDVSFNIL